MGIFPKRLAVLGMVALTVAVTRTACARGDQALTMEHEDNIIIEDTTHGHTSVLTTNVADVAVYTPTGETGGTTTATVVPETIPTEATDVMRDEECTSVKAAIYTLNVEPSIDAVGKTNCFDAHVCVCSFIVVHPYQRGCWAYDIFQKLAREHV